MIVMKQETETVKGNGDSEANNKQSNREKIRDLLRLEYEDQVLTN